MAKSTYVLNDGSHPADGTTIATNATWSTALEVRNNSTAAVGNFSISGQLDPRLVNAVGSDACDVQAGNRVVCTVAATIPAGGRLVVGSIDANAPSTAGGVITNTFNLYQGTTAKVLVATASDSETVVTAAAAAASFVPQAGAFAATTPAASPSSPHQIIVFPRRDFVSSSGFDPTLTYKVEVFRNALQIGRVEGIAPQEDPKAPGTWLLDVNHPAAVATNATYCWTGVTPDIKAGDIVRVTDSRGRADQTTTSGVTTSAPTVTPAINTAVPGGYTVRLNITAPGLTAAQVTDQVESRLVAKKNSFQKSGKRTLRAGVVPQDGTIKSNGAGGWVAEYPNLSLSDAQMVMNGSATQYRVLWLGANPLAATELTIYEQNQVAAGPQAPCTAPLAP